MRLALTGILAGLLTLAPQDGDRSKFDDLVRQLDDDALDVRDSAVKALVAMADGADAWLKEAVGKSSGERKARLESVIRERAFCIERIRLVKLGLRENTARAVPDFAKRLFSKDAGLRLALLVDFQASPLIRTMTTLRRPRNWRCRLPPPANLPSFPRSSSVIHRRGS